ncbi:MAG: hypothetical protein WA906_07980 [Pacificimonas sp.]
MARHKEEMLPAISPPSAKPSVGSSPASRQGSRGDLFRLDWPDGDAAEIAASAFEGLGAGPSERHAAVAAASRDDGRRRGYSHIVPGLRAMASHLDRKLVLFAAMADFESAFAARGFPMSTRPYFIDAFHRMAMTWTAADVPADLEYTDFVKDLAIVSLRLVPSGARLIDPTSGFARRFLPTLGVAGAAQATRYLMKSCGGFGPMLELHVHNPVPHYFSEGGFRLTTRIAADLLENDPALRGVIAASWFYDPAVAEVSPHLCYLVTLPGALYVEGRTTEETRKLAAKASKTRRRALAEGRYDPRRFWMLWDRASVLSAAATLPPEEASA